jgi:hypothetical protein
MVLTVFFKLLGSVSGRAGASVTRITFKGILDDRSRATVHLSNGTSFKGARFIGFTDSGAIKGPFPYPLHGMVVLELTDGTRVLVLAKLIRMIEVRPSEVCPVTPADLPLSRWHDPTSRQQGDLPPWR